MALSKMALGKMAMGKRVFGEANWVNCPNNDMKISQLNLRPFNPIKYSSW